MTVKRAKPKKSASLIGDYFDVPVSVVLKNARLESGLNQRTLAERCGLKRAQTIRAIEGSKTGEVTFAIVRQIANGLAISLEDVSRQMGKVQLGPKPSYAMEPRDDDKGGPLTLGLIIKRLRIRSGYSQKGLAQVARVTQQGIGNVESGYYQASFWMMRQLCAALNLSLDAISARLGSVPDGNIDAENQRDLKKWK